MSDSINCFICNSPVIQRENAVVIIDSKVKCHSCWSITNNWSDDPEELQEQVKTISERLGFDFPTTEEEMRRFNEATKNYPYKANPDNIDPEKI